MKAKALFLIIILALLVQVYFLINAEKKNIARINQATSGLTAQTQQLQAEKETLKKDQARLKAIVESIPPRLLTGFEDPEVSYFEFLDRLPNLMSDEAITKVQGSVSSGKPVFRDKPIPLQETDLSFEYSFTATSDVENFLHYILSLDQWPMRVKTLSAQRSGPGLASGKMTASLLIPAKLKIRPAEAKSLEAK